MSIYLVTGASSGLGRHLAEAALHRGDSVAAVARRVERLETLSAAHPGRVLPIAADLSSAEGTKAVVEACLARFGQIDVLINNAGRGSLGAAEEFSAAELRAQLELNFVSCAELIRNALPHMRSRRSGAIVNVSSIGGRVNVGGFSAYGAGKFALEGYSEALADEVRPFGIRVMIVEPGALRTEFAGDANLRPATHLEAYDPALAGIRSYLYGSSGRQAGDPAKAAALILKAVHSPDAPLRLMLGSDAYGLWEAKEAVARAELDRWRSQGEAIAFDPASTAPIG